MLRHISASTSIVKFVVITALITIGLSTAAEAAKKGLKASKDDVFTVDLPNGKTIDCLERKGKVLAGKARTKGNKTVFFPEKLKYQAALKSLERQRSRIGEKKFKKKKKNLKRNFGDKTIACGGGGVDPYTQPLTYDDVTYLYKKAAFAAAPADYAACVGKRAEICVDRMMSFDSTAGNRILNEATRWLDENYDEGNYLPDRSISGNGLEQALLHILLNTPNQYHAKLGILFLHHHFAASYRIVEGNGGQRYLAWEYMKKLMSASVDGNFRQLVDNMFHDELQQIWLDGDENTKFAPNQNLGREFFELWTIGPVDLKGNRNYSEENDIVQVARAFTGFDVTPIEVAPDEYDWSLSFQYGAFDPGTKTLWPGQPHQAQVVSADDLIDATMDGNPQAPVHLARRLLTRYLTFNPSPGLVNALARIVKQNNFNLHAAMRKLLTSKTFFAPINRRALQRETVEMLIGSMRTLMLQGMPVDLVNVRRGAEAAGQELGSPPTVFGWATDRWANAQEKLNLFNNFVSQLNRDNEFDDAGFSFLQLLDGMPAADRLDESKVLAHLERMFGIQFPADHRAQILEYMNNDMNYQDELDRVRWDPTEERARVKIPGILELIFVADQLK